MLAQQHALFADEQAAVVGQRLPFGQRRQLFGGQQSAVVPHDANGAVRSCISFRGIRSKIVSDLGNVSGFGGGPSYQTFVGAVSPRLQIDGVDDVAAHIAQCPCAKSNQPRQANG